MLELFPAFGAVVSFISLNVQGIQIVKDTGVEGFPVYRLVRRIKVKGGGFPEVGGARGHGN